MTFAQPWWLLAALIALPCVWTAWRWFRSMTRARAVSAGVARALLLALLAMALAGAASVRESDRVAVVALVDLSDSVRQYADAFADLTPDPDGRRPRLAEAVQRWLTRSIDPDQGRRPDDAVGLVVFAGDSAAVSLPSAAERSEFPLDRTPPDGTDIERALRFAQGVFPPGVRRRVVLFSDGRATSGDALAAARELGALGTRVDVVPISYAVANEVMISAIDTPPNAAPGARVRARVVLDATDAATGTLRVTYEGRELDINGAEPGAGRRLTLAPGRRIEMVDVELNDDRVHTLEAVFEPDDDAADRVDANNRAQAFTITPGSGAVLVVNQTGQPDTLTNALQSRGLRVQTVAPGDTPTDLLRMQSYDLVMLENVGAYDMPPAAHRVLREFVATLGGGLVMVGGERSFGAGGWMGTELEDILPVRLDLPEQLITPQAAVAFVLDSSGSMGQPVAGSLKSQMQIASESAALAISTMETTDLVEVIAFNSDYSVIVPLERNTDKKAIADRVRTIAPGGGTNMYPALAKAVADLRTADAKVKHVILLSDGQSMGDPSEGVQIAQMAREFGISITTIAVGDGAASEVLAQIAAEGDGQFHEVFNVDMLPRIFIKEILVVRKPLIRLGAFDPVDLRSGSSLIAGIPAPWPALRGINLTQRKDDPKIVYAMASPQGEPLLAHWFVGRGQVAAFMSDASTDWASRWLNWPGYGAMWSQIARLISRPSGEPGLELTTEIVDGQLIVRLDATGNEGRPRDMLSVPGAIYTPSGRPIEVTLTQTGPGVYETRLPAEESGNYVVALLPKEGARSLPLVMGGASRALSPEMAHLTSDIAALRRIAEATGGKVLSLRAPEVARLFERDDSPPQRASTPLWQLLLTWALAVFLFDVGTRRVAWDRLVSRRVVEEVRERAMAAVRARSDRAASTAATLRQVSESRAAPRAGGPPPPPAPIMDRRPGARPIEDDDPDTLRAAARAKQEADRRQAARDRMLNRLGGAKQPPADQPARPPRPGAPSAQPSEDTTSGLLRAKRRARERLSGEDDPSDASSADTPPRG